MARTYREIAIEEMLGTVEEAMREVDWWGDLPPPMKEAIEAVHESGYALSVGSIQRGDMPGLGG